MEHELLHFIEPSGKFRVSGFVHKVFTYFPGICNLNEGGSITFNKLYSFLSSVKILGKQFQEQNEKSHSDRGFCYLLQLI